MPQASFILPAIVTGGLILGWIIARWLERRFDRNRSTTSDELLDELETAFTPRRSLEVRLPPDRLKACLDCVAAHVESCFGPRQVRLLHRRLAALRDAAIHHAYFPVKVNGVRTNLDLQWSRDADGRVRLLVLAVPKIIRELKKQLKVPPPAPVPPREAAVR